MTPDPSPTAARRRGRFAPSPTGPLHFGSLVAAVGSFLDARSHGGEWLVRIEDLDPPREVPGAATAILRLLERCALAWDGSVEYQSTRAALYDAALERLRRDGLVYPCACTRAEIAGSAAMGIEGYIYPGTCRAGLAPGRAPRALRVRTTAEVIAFDDRVQGPRSQVLERDIGDFVLRRADGLAAYQLAVVVDDAAQGITDVVRGADLLSSTPRQIWLARLLGLPSPTWAHLPVAVDAAGEKLSKQTLAPAVDAAEPLPALLETLRFLGQAVPDAGEVGTPEALWAWAVPRWDLARVPKAARRPAPPTR